MKIYKKILIALLLTLVCGGLVLAAKDHYVLDRLEKISYDARMLLLRGQKQANSNVAVVLVDEASLRAMNSVIGRWPWPRAVMADILDFISMGQPKAIVIDVLFAENERDGMTPGDSAGPGDLRLAEATAGAGNIIHAAQLLHDVEDEYNKGLLNIPLPENFKKSFAVPVIYKGPPGTEPTSANTYSIPITELVGSAMAIGAVDFEPDSDGVFRRTRLLRKYGDEYYPLLGFSGPLRELSKDTPVELTSEALTLNGREIALDGSGSYLVNFYGKLETYSMSGVISSLQKMLKGDVENMIIQPSEFKDKYILLGTSAAGAYDLKVTPVGSKTPGAFIQASVLSNFLDMDFLKLTPGWFTVAATLVLSASAAFSILFIRKMWVQVGIPAVLTILYIALCFVAFSKGTVAPIAAPVSAGGLAIISSLFVFGVTEGRDRRKVRQLFSLYVSTDVLDKVLDNYEAQLKVEQGTEEQVSVLFSDIRNFTTLSETLPATRVVEMLNVYFEEMTEAIFKYGGTVDKFIGDAIMSFWGAPIFDPEHAKKAVKSALLMMQKLDHANQELVKRGFEPLAIGIGINTGHVVLGNIGSHRKLNYTVIGDSVNLASRMEGLTKNYGSPIMYTQTTYDDVKDEIPSGVVDAVRVKGKHQPVRIYKPLVGLDPTPEELAKARALEVDMHQAFELYLARKWESAENAYRNLPQDFYSNLMLGRIEHFKQEDPGENWDGAYTLKSK